MKNKIKKEIKLLETILQKCWSKETCYPPLQKDWSQENPALGQCAITALIVQDYFGGELLYCKHHKHYWNKLPNGEEVDFTRSQFPNNTKICIDEVKTGDFEPNYEYNREALTLERYAMLKNKVTRFFKTNNSKNCWIYLTSSNSTKEYILDILETMFLPIGAIQYFRYQLRWLDDTLRKSLPKKGERMKDILNGAKVVICYLYQEEAKTEKNKSEMKWRSIYPIRIGILLDAYKTGDADLDVAYFYFKVNEYISYNGQDYNSIMKQVAGEKFNDKYAFLSFSLNKCCLSKKEHNQSAFYRICEALELNHFKSPNGESQYYPLFCFMNGLKDKKGEVLIPEYQPLTRKSYYIIEECDQYFFDFSTYFAKKQAVIPYEVMLKSDNKIFSTPENYKLNISSRYDEESWTIASSFLEKNIWTVMKFEVRLINNNIPNSIPLNISITFPIKVIRKMKYRIIDYLGDLGFMVGTGSIALSKILGDRWGWWYHPVWVGYLIWAICKFIIKIWRE